MNFDLLVREHHAVVYRVALGVLRKPDLAEDVAQDVFLSLLQRPASLQGIHDTRAFLARCARNRAISLGKSNQVRESYENRADRGETTMEPAETVFRRELRARVDQLPEEERAAVDLHYFQGLTLAQSAEALEVSDRTVSARLRAALESLRRVFAGGAFVALVANLEGELRACEPAPVPAGLEARLRGLEAGSTAPVSGSGPARAPGVRFLAGGLALVAVLGMLTGLAWRQWQASPGDARPGRAGAAISAAEHTPERAMDTGSQVSATRETADSATVEPLSGHVVDSSGRPIAGAQVEAVPPGAGRRGSAARGAGNPVTRATTGADGEFRIALAAGETADLEASAEGLSTARLASVSAGERVRLVLGPGAALTVRVRDTESRPVRGARIVVLPDGAGDLPWATDPGDREWQKRPDATGGDTEGVTDEAGECTLTGLEAGAGCGIHAAATGLAEGHIRVTLSDSGVTVADLVLEAGRTARGRVLDAATGRPISGALVRRPWDPALVRLRGDAAATVRTDAEGNFVMPGWPADDRVLPSASAAGFWPRALTRVGPSTFEGHLPPAPRITGRVVDDAGKPVAPATVASIEDSAPVDPEGRYSISVPEGDVSEGWFYLTAFAPGRGRGTLRLPFSNRDIDAGDLVIPANHLLRGILLSRERVPVPRGLITLGAPEGLGLAVRTDDRGRFTFRDVPEGEWYLEAQAEGICSVGCIVLVPTDPGRELEILLPPMSPLTVTVVTEEGTPVPDLLVSATIGVPTHDVWERPCYARTGPDGVARIETGGADLAVRIGLAERLPAGFLAVPDRLIEGAVDSARIVLRRGGTISGAVVDPEGRPIPCREVAAILGDREEIYSTAGAGDGRFELTAPPGVEVTIEVAPVVPWNAPRSFAVARFPGFRAGDTSARLVVDTPSADATLTVRVLLPDGTPARDAQVILDREGVDLLATGGAASARTDTRGEATFTGLAPDRVAALARPGRNAGHGPSSQLTVVPGNTVVLRLSPGK